MPSSFEDLEIWKLAHKLCLEVYDLSRSFPPEERYGLTSQMRRSAASVEANIAEAHGLYHYAETVHFLQRARGSLEETRNHLILGGDLGYLSKDRFETINNGYIELRKMMNGYIRSIMTHRVTSR